MFLYSTDSTLNPVREVVARTGAARQGSNSEGGRQRNAGGLSRGAAGSERARHHSRGRCGGGGAFLAKYEPIVGIVVTTSPSFSLYKMVVLPAASKPTIRMRISCFANSLSNNCTQRGSGEQA